MKTDKTYLFLCLLLLFTITSWISSCSHKADLSGIPAVCFERDVFPIFLNSCAKPACHDGTGESELVLTDFSSIRNGVVPGAPYSSPLYKSIISTTGENKMPPDQPISIDNRILIRVWIEQGAEQIPCPGK
ncbi:MAG: c-type cytochrome domain-containing protein [Bacteroidales bacterium]